MWSASVDSKVDVRRDYVMWVLQVLSEVFAFHYKEEEWQVWARLLRSNK